MNWTELEKHFSTARVGRYLSSCGNDETRAAQAYIGNMLLSEATMPMLSTLEIALKNSIDRRLTTLYNRSDWWEAWRGNEDFNWQLQQVASAKEKLRRHREPATPGKIIAELAFGFWSSLFNASFQMELWGTLRLVFPHCPRVQRQRGTISSALSQVREFRNRVFHHEQIVWLTPPVLDVHAKCNEVLQWIDPQLPPWLAQYDRFPAVWAGMQPI